MATVARDTAARRTGLVVFWLLPALALVSLAAALLSQFAPTGALANTCIPPFHECLPPDSDVAVLLRLAVALVIGTAIAAAMATLRARRLQREDERALGLAPGELGQRSWWRRAPEEPLYLRLR